MARVKPEKEKTEMPPPVVGGDSERWCPVAEFPVYEISDRGRLRRLGKPRILTIKNAGREYPYYVLYKNNKMHKRKVGQLVLTAFVGPRPKNFECCHKDDNKNNNNCDNLYWGTRQQNLEDQRRNGKFPKGESHGSATITNHEAKCIKEAIKSEPNWKYGDGRKLAEKFGVSEGIISRIRLGRAWSHL